jgi:NTP pyrophosphatase (non-canonical NTP hydrolase)
MKEIADWQAVTFPHQDPQGIGYKLVEEAQEVARAILWEQNVGEEAADVLFMLVSTCSAFGIDLAMEARKKLHKNKKRTWKEPDELGRISHKQDV